MKNIRTLVAVATLGSSSMLAAQPSQATPPSKQAPPVSSQSPKKQTEPPRSTETPPKLESEVKSNLLPVVAGIDSASVAAGALEELATTQPFERKDARETAKLAQDATTIAHARAEALHNVKGLSPEARTEVGAAAKSLKRASAAAKSIEREVGVIEGRFRKHEAEKVRTEALRLQNELSAARASIDKVAGEYHVSTRLGMREKSASGQR